MFVMFGVSVMPHGPVSIISLAGLCLFGAAIMVSDLETLTIPDWATLGIAGVATGHLAVYEPALLTWRAGTGLAVLATLWFLATWLERHQGRTMIGLGDVKLIAASSMLIGLELLPLQLSLAALGALAFGILRAWRKGRPLRRKSAVPFGAFLAPSLVFVWCAGQAGKAVV